MYKIFKKRNLITFVYFKTEATEDTVATVERDIVDTAEAEVAADGTEVTNQLCC
jgi:hypothetical protein